MGNIRSGIKIAIVFALGVGGAMAGFWYSLPNVERKPAAFKFTLPSFPSLSFQANQAEPPAAVTPPAPPPAPSPAPSVPPAVTATPQPLLIEEPPQSTLTPPTVPPQVAMPPAQVDVDSYAAADLQALDLGSQISGTYGYVDSVSIGGDHPGALASRALTNDDVLQVSGWAGHQGLGMTMPRVLFALCDQVVGGVSVGDARPDVAKAVHPYLDRSGWRAQLAVAHLPRCEVPKLMAFGLGSKGRNLWPLAAHTPLVLPSPGGASAKRFVGRASPIVLDAIPIPQPSNITITASSLRLRICGSKKCKALRSVTNGTFKGYVIERRNGWALVQLPDISGWLSEKYLRIDG